MRSEPREIAERLEREAALPDGTDERFDGWGLMGLPFRSGHVLAMRRFPASSIGPGYSSVWHRDPGGAWSIFTDVDPWMACNRFLGSGLSEAGRCGIDIEWTGPRAFRVGMADRGGLDWRVEVRATLATRVMGLAGRALPYALWRSDAVLSAMGRIAGPLLGVGRVALHGRMPNGQRFQANTRLLWMVERSTATLDGEDLGEPGPLSEQVRLGDFWVPQRGVLAFGQTYFEPFDPQRHVEAIVGPVAGGR